MYYTKKKLLSCLACMGILCAYSICLWVEVDKPRGGVRVDVKLNNGVAMPSPGFGTRAIRGWQADNDEVAEVVAEAIQVGYRHLDTASIYGNERSVGYAIRESGIARNELFVATKAWNMEYGYEQILRALDNSLRRLDVEYLDLYLLHWPFPDMIAEAGVRWENYVMTAGFAQSASPTFV